MTLASDPANLPQYASISACQHQDDDVIEDDDEGNDEEHLGCAVSQVNHRFKRNFLEKPPTCLIFAIANTTEEELGCNACHCFCYSARVIVIASASSVTVS